MKNATAWSPKLHDIWVYEFDNETVQRLHRRIERCSDDGQNVLPCYIVSGGGSVIHLLAMQDLIRSAEANEVKVATICLGQALSAGADLLASGTKGMRWAGSGARIMVHESSTELPTDKLRENQVRLASEIEDEAVSFVRLDANCGKPKGYFLRELAKRKFANWYMTAKTAKRHGLVDHIGVPVFETESKVSIKAPTSK